MPLVQITMKSNFFRGMGWTHSKSAEWICSAECSVMYPGLKFNAPLAVLTCRTPGASKHNQDMTGDTQSLKPATAPPPPLCDQRLHVSGTV